MVDGFRCLKESPLAPSTCSFEKDNGFSLQGNAMKIRRKVLGLTLLLLAGVALLCLALRPREPVFDGRPLSVWLQELGSENSVKANRAREAVKAMGTNALPTLIHLLGTRESFLKAKLRR